MCPVPAEPSILCAAEDLAPADTAGLDPALVVGLATTLGGPTSHTAIIARQLGIPCVVAVNGLDDVPAGTPVLIDGTRGSVTLARPAEAQAAVRAADELLAAMAGWTGPGRRPTAIRSRSWPTFRTVRRPARPGDPAEGIGLFRTELCFLNRDTEPTVEEQTAIYAEVFEAFRRPQGRHPHPGRRIGQTAEVRRPSRRGQPGARGARDPDRRRQSALLTHQLEAIAGAAARAGPRPG